MNYFQLLLTDGIFTYTTLGLDYRGPTSGAGGR